MEVYQIPFIAGGNWGVRSEIEGEFVFVSDTLSDDLASNSGRVDIYRKDPISNVYDPHSTIFPQNVTGSNIRFGSSLSAYNDRLLIGAENQSRVYMYKYNSGTNNWDFEQFFDGYSLLGSGVSINEFGMAHGAKNDDSNQGIINIYQYNSNTDNYDFVDQYESDKFSVNLGGGVVLGSKYLLSTFESRYLHTVNLVRNPSIYNLIGLGLVTPPAGPPATRTVIKVLEYNSAGNQILEIYFDDGTYLIQTIFTNGVIEVIHYDENDDILTQHDQNCAITFNYTIDFVPDKVLDTDVTAVDHKTIDENYDNNVDTYNEPDSFIQTLGNELNKLTEVDPDTPLLVGGFYVGNAYVGIGISTSQVNADTYYKIGNWDMFSDGEITGSAPEDFDEEFGVYDDSTGNLIPAGNKAAIGL